MAPVAAPLEAFVLCPALLACAEFASVEAALLAGASLDL
jgi:hypothetical protein